MDVVKNFAKVVVSIGYAAGATSITLSTGHGAKLPDPAADGAFNLVWWNVTDYPDPTDDSSAEIVRCTARAGDVLTVTRAQESTADVAHNAATKTYQMILSLTKKMIDDIATALTAALYNIVEDITPQAGGDFDLQTHKLVGEGGSDGVYVDSAGFVGIGTDAPTQKLHVVVSYSGSSNLSAGRIAAFVNDGTTTTNSVFAVIAGNAGESGIDLGDAQDQNVGGIYYDHTNNYMNLVTNGVRDRVIIDSDGDVGLGTLSPTAKLDVNSDILRLRTAKTPATAGAAGNQGDWCWDADYIYVCVATNTWKRSALTTW